ncbi:sulfurtransferase [Tenacibaculum amylolyticum]|uniref:sulfurtransferase n=1 Tax=Tenacibaculum amylolyticum TaxID=104269 RepID=UPI0038930573
MLQITSPVVSVEWLYKNINAENLIVLDGTIKKVTATEVHKTEKKQIPNSIFFDLKGVFLNKEGQYPNTIPEEAYFEEKVQELGINEDSCIVVYDDLGIYSAARVWWLFKTFGFQNIAVLNGGFPAWEKEGYVTEFPVEKKLKKGSFKATFIPSKFTNFHEVRINIDSQQFCAVDARSEGRFTAKEPEPRKDLEGGHIPNSKNLPFTVVQQDGKMKPKEELIELFNKVNSEHKDYIFTCGSGITACILALALEITGKTNYAVYDGSWTEWASIKDLPIEK